jgi:hypothetical protein
MNVTKRAYKPRKEIASFYDLMTALATKLIDQFFESEPLGRIKNNVLLVYCKIGGVQAHRDETTSGLTSEHLVLRNR